MIGPERLLAKIGVPINAEVSCMCRRFIPGIALDVCIEEMQTRKSNYHFIVGFIVEYGESRNHNKRVGNPHIKLLFNKSCPDSSSNTLKWKQNPSWCLASICKALQTLVEIRSIGQVNNVYRTRGTVSAFLGKYSWFRDLAHNTVSILIGWFCTNARDTFCLAV